MLEKITSFLKGIWNKIFGESDKHFRVRKLPIRLFGFTEMPAAPIIIRELGSLTLDITQFSCEDLGEVIVTLTADDASGNSSAETAVVTVLDETAPIQTCPNDIFSNFCSFPVDYPVPTAEDNCADVLVELIAGLLSGEVFPTGTTSVEYLATDPSGNETTCSFTVTVLTDMTADAEVIEPDCAGLETGEASLMIEGGTPPFEYQWDDPNMQTTSTANNLAAGYYSATITDATGCQIGATVEITEPEELIAEVEMTEPDCFGDETGTATALPTGGTIPYTYQWNDPNMQTSQTANTLIAGNYEVIVLDANNCETTTVVTIEEPTEVQITLDEIIDETGQNSDGLISISPSGGTNMDYTFEWTFNGSFYSNEEDLENLMGGEYCVTLTDGNACQQSDCFTVDIIDGTHNLGLEKYISIIPNPTSDWLNVKWKLPNTAKVKLHFYDLLGRKVLAEREAKGAKSELKFDVSSLPSGLYFLKIEIGNEYLIQRVMVE